MTSRSLLLCVALVVALSAAAHADADPDPGRVEKRQLERSQFVPYGPYAPREPSCEQLRAMWKLSKRQHRNAMASNVVPRYQDNYLLDRVRDTLSHRPLYDPRRPPPQQHTFGTLVRTPDQHQRKFETPALNQLRASLPPGRSEDEKVREVWRILGRPSAAPQGATSESQFGRVVLYPRDRDPADNSRRMFPRSVPLPQQRHQRVSIRHR